MSDYEDLCAVLYPFGHFDIGSTWPAGLPMWQHCEPFSFTIDGALTVPAGLLDAATPKDARQYLLGRFEALLAALRGNRFVLHQAPEIRFGGYLTPAVWTIGGEVAINEHESCISAHVDIGVLRATKIRARHGHSEDGAE